MAVTLRCMTLCLYTLYWCRIFKNNKTIMSAIYGIINRNQQPISPEVLKTMMEAVSFYGTDGSRVWQEGTVALAHQMLHHPRVAP